MIESADRTWPNDNPIKSSTDDLLGRAKIAQEFACNLRELDASEGSVVAIMGPWGSGKSSFLNMVKEELAREPSLTVVDFNPWMFSGSQQLVDVFFREVASTLRLANKSKFGQIAEALDEYGDVFSPVAVLPLVGAWWDRTQKSYKAARKWWKERGATPMRVKVEAALAELDQPLIVAIDDIDRLTTDEVRDIFKLVRLTASFPSVIYLLLFDRSRVESALEESGAPGPDYLAKIVQLGFDLPVIPQGVVRSQVLLELDAIVAGVKNLRFSPERWDRIYLEVVEPLIGNLRDVKRLVLSARPTIQALGSQIDVTDLIAMETVRVQRPNSFTAVCKLRYELAGGLPRVTRHPGPVSPRLALLLSDFADDEDAVRSLLELVFPAANPSEDEWHYGPGEPKVWKRERRLADPDFMNLYLERVAPAGVNALQCAEESLLRLADEARLEEFLTSLRPAELDDVIAGLEAFEESYTAEAVVPASVVLLNLIASIPDRPLRGMFDMWRKDVNVGRVVSRLLGTITDESEREDAVTEILSRVRSFSSKRYLIRLVGREEGSGLNLVSEEFAATLVAELIAAARGQHSPVPDEEWDFLRVQWQLWEARGADFEPLAYTDPDEIRSLFQSARTEAQTQTLGGYRVRQEERLAWGELTRAFGSDEALRAARDVLKNADGESELVRLIDKYLAGWRPDHWMSDNDD